MKVSRIRYASVGAGDPPLTAYISQEITVTNYTGEAREYLKKLITTMGASFTPSMTGKNTVLIAA